MENSIANPTIVNLHLNGSLIEKFELTVTPAELQMASDIRETTKSTAHLKELVMKALLDCLSNSLQPENAGQLLEVQKS